MDGWLLSVSAGRPCFEPRKSVQDLAYRAVIHHTLLFDLYLPDSVEEEPTKTICKEQRAEKHKL